MLIQLYSDGRYDISGPDMSPFVSVSVGEDSGLRIDQGYFGSGSPIYYSRIKDSLFVSDSLKKIKDATGIKFELNTQMLPHFLYNGFISGNHTLVKGVYKLPLNKSVTVKKDKVSVEDWTYESDCTPGGFNGSHRGLGEAELSELESAYKEYLCQSIRRLCCGEESKPIYIALSGGFDSNCLLYFARNLFNRRDFIAVSVGGDSGTDERTVAGEIAEQYGNVRLEDCTVSSDTLNNLDDIVLRLEGSVYERGIFLQYELARALKRLGADCILCGECADQVFHERSYLQCDDRFLYDYLNTPRQMAAYVVLPKSFIMLKTFGIKGLYPYLDKKVVEVGRVTASVNASSKIFHKRFCEHNLPCDVFAKLKKEGGSTSLTALFDDIPNLETAVQRMKYYDPSFKLTGKYEQNEALMDYWLSLKYIESFERQFCD